jgi:hypothetical protein
MKVTVTHLKAPWPAGTAHGHVVDFPGLDADAIPAWAVGKCTPAADDAEAVSTWTRPVVAPAELASEPIKAPAGEPVVNPEAVTAAPAAAGSADAAAAPAADAAAPAAAPARKTAAKAPAAGA